MANGTKQATTTIPTALKLRVAHGETGATEGLTLSLDTLMNTNYDSVDIRKVPP